jgi:two-component system response regulator FixJ
MIFENSYKIDHMSWSVRGSIVIAPPLVDLFEGRAAVRATVTGILERSGFRVREHARAGRLLSHGASPDADCTLTGLHLPGIDGLDSLARFRTLCAAVPIIVLARHGDVSLAVLAMKLGACDCIETPIDPDALVQAVRAAVSGAGCPVGMAQRRQASKRLARLTPREDQVLEQVLLGRNHREIGDHLAISPRTVEVFRARIMTKTACHTIQDLVRVAIEAGRDQGAAHLNRGIADIRACP